LAFRDTGGNDDGKQANAVIMSNTVLEWTRPETWTAMIDRSPCGTGTAAIMATLHARGLLNVGETFDHYSILGSKFRGTVLGETTLPGGRVAILPRIEGSACITQYSEVVVDEDYDPFPEGYKVADIW
jgi:proline racemase